MTKKQRQQKKPRMQTRAQVEWSLRYHVEELDKAIARRDAAKVGTGEYDYARFNWIHHGAAVMALAHVLGIEGNEAAICAQVRAAGKKADAPTPTINPEEHEQ